MIIQPNYGIFILFKVFLCNTEVINEYDKKEKYDDQSGLQSTSSFWKCISHDENKVTYNIIKKYQDKPWKWDGILQNSNITMDMIEENHDKPWDWSLLVYNPNITIDFIEKYKDKILPPNEVSVGIFNLSKNQL